MKGLKETKESQQQVLGSVEKYHIEQVAECPCVLATASDSRDLVNRTVAVAFRPATPTFPTHTQSVWAGGRGPRGLCMPVWIRGGRSAFGDPDQALAVECMGQQLAHGVSVPGRDASQFPC